MRVSHIAVIIGTFYQTLLSDMSQSSELIQSAQRTLRRNSKP